MRTIEVGAIVLIALVIAGAFFAGLSTDAQTLGGVGVKLVNVFQGRNAAGNFPAYPAGAPSVTNA